MAQKIKQKRLDSTVMFPMVELFEDSGMTQHKFCAEMDLVPHTFTYWLNKYRRSKNKRVNNETKPEFVELAISPGSESVLSTRLIRITYPDGTLVELPVS
jgi:hypothetical protein